MWNNWRNLALGTTCLTGLLMAGLPVSAQTLPSGGNFVVGGGAIATNGSTMTVTQQGGRGIVHWDSFSVGQGGAVAFNNGTGATLNRVTGGDASSIMGRLTATGSLYLVNPNGVVVGPSGVVTTGGSFVASTHDVTNDAFLSGSNLTFKGDSAATVENLGSISSTGGDVLLIAREVSNSGAISAPKGTAALAGGHEVLLTESNNDGKGRVMVRVGPGKADNQGTIQAAQVELKAAGGNIYALAGNNGGVIRATGSATRGGEVWLTADDGHVSNNGTVSATNADGSGGRVTVSATGGKAVVNTGTLSANGTRGGAVTVKANRVSNQGKITADGAAGAGGSVDIAYGKTYIDTSGSSLSARGSSRGGTISVNGGQSDSTLFASGRHRADGGEGAGGSIDLFAAAINLFGGTIDASGAVQGGSVRVGGDYQGSGDMLKAGTVTVSGATTVRADASGADGTGGRVVIWSEDKTDFYGKASARGGSRRGDGGFIEVSSHDTLLFAGTGDAGATNGAAGALLLDPKNIIVSAGADGALPQYQYVDPNPVAGNAFGTTVTVLPTGNVVIGASSDDFTAAGAGASYLFNGLTGALISTLTGASAGEGLGGAPTVIGDNYLYARAGWTNNGATSAGAVTWGSGVTGVAGVVSATNSLVGTSANDKVGSAVNPLGNGNYLVSASSWTNGTAASAGALTWFRGTAGITGAVSATNSLVGTSANDKVGGTIALRPDGSYVMRASSWTNGTATSAGAVTWGSGTTAITGAVSATNSLVGTSANDSVGGTITFLSNGNYVVTSSGWSNGTATKAGAATWGSGTVGITGVVSAVNSLVGTSVNDGQGIQVKSLANGNYIVAASSWTNGVAGAAGAVTWINGTTGLTGVISTTNSLVGSTPNDAVGKTLTALTNGNYVVSTTQWTNGTMISAGAVTWATGPPDAPAWSPPPTAWWEARPAPGSAARWQR